MRGLHETGNGNCIWHAVRLGRLNGGWSSGVTTAAQGSMGASLAISARFSCLERHNTTRAVVLGASFWSVARPVIRWFLQRSFSPGTTVILRPLSVHRIITLLSICSDALNDLTHQKSDSNGPIGDKAKAGLLGKGANEPSRNI